MKNISQEELKEILKKHKMWLKDEEGGKRADLSGANLMGSNLRAANLTYADLIGANLSNADLWNTDLIGADLTCANLSNADLSRADLSTADLINTDLTDANLTCANLTYVKLNDANLINTDLTGANLWCANLIGANLKNIKTNMNTIGYNLACPEKGSFVGYKKAGGCIVELLILEDSKRSSATTAKCRCNKAMVLNIEEIYTGKKVKKVISNHNPNFVYEVGEIVTVDDFDDNRWNECSTGIHFFMNKENALNYQ